ADALWRRQIQGGKHGLRTVLGVRLAQGQKVAGAQRPPGEAAKAGAGIGRLAAKGRSHVEAALDREVADRASRKAAHAQHLTLAQAHALKGRKTGSPRRAFSAKGLDCRRATGESEARALGLH